MARPATTGLECSVKYRPEHPGEDWEVKFLVHWKLREGERLDGQAFSVFCTMKGVNLSQINASSVDLIGLRAAKGIPLECRVAYTCRLAGSRNGLLRMTVLAVTITEKFRSTTMSSSNLETEKAHILKLTSLHTPIDLWGSHRVS